MFPEQTYRTLLMEPITPPDKDHMIHTTEEDRLPRYWYELPWQKGDLTTRDVVYWTWGGRCFKSKCLRC